MDELFFVLFFLKVFIWIIKEIVIEIFYLLVIYIWFLKIFGIKNFNL